MAKTEEKRPKNGSNLPAAPRVEEEWEKRLREQARDDTSKFATGVSRITVSTDKKGNLTFVADGNEIGQEIVFVPIETAWSKQLYLTPYVAGRAATPDCYALGAKERGLVPHPNAPQKQAEQCDGCQHNKFGTAEVGRGKRCGDKPRLAVILFHDVEGKDENAVRKASVYQLDIPPASIGNFGEYLVSLRDLTPHANFREAVTRARAQMRPGAKGHEIKFEFEGLVPEKAMPVVLARGPSAYEQMTQPFPVLEAMEPEKPIKGQEKARARK